MPSVVEADASGGHAVEGFWGEVSFEGDVVGFLDFVAWVHDAFGEFSVVGHEDEAFGVVVEAAHVEDVGVLVADDVGECPASFFVVHGGEDFFGFVDGEDDGFSVVDFDGGSVDADGLVWFYFCSEFGDDCSIEFDASLLD